MGNSIAKDFKKDLDKKKRKSSVCDDTCTYIMQYLNGSKDVLELGGKECKLYKRLSGDCKSYFVVDKVKIINKEESKAKLFTMDLSKLEFPANKFDIAIVSKVLQEEEDYDRILSECYRVLRPNGLIIVIGYLFERKSSPLKLLFKGIKNAGSLHKWGRNDYNRLLTTHGFNIIDRKQLPGEALMQLFIVGKRL